MSETKPTRLDPEWTDYIMDQMLPDEKWDGIPRMDGLRRMVEMHVGRIVGLDVSILSVTTTYLTIIATATVKLENGEIYSASSDANMWNSPEDFKNKLTALADTRAKSKAFREILGLRNTFSAEERDSTDDLEADQFITRPQILAIESLCRDLKIKTENAIKHFLTDPPSSIEKMRITQGVELVGKLGDIKHNRLDLPSELKT